MLPRRLGVRFALEAGFLVLLALGAGLADLRPLYIVIIMAAAWVLVALAELTAERIDRSPLSYLLPRSAWDEEEGPKRVFEPRVEERTVVAPPEAAAKDEAPEEEAEPEELTVLEPAPTPEPEPEREPEPEPKEEPEEPAVAEEPSAPSSVRGVRRRFRRRLPEPEPEPRAEPVEPEEAEAEEKEPSEPSSGRRARRLFRRQEPEPEVPEPAPPRHVKLLPRRTAPEASRAIQEVAELFGPRAGGEDEPEKPKETGT